MYSSLEPGVASSFYSLIVDEYLPLFRPSLDYLFALKLLTFLALLSDALLSSKFWE